MIFQDMQWSQLIYLFSHHMIDSFSLRRCELSRFEVLVSRQNLARPSSLRDTAGWLDMTISKQSFCKIQENSLKFYNLSQQSFRVSKCRLLATHRPPHLLGFPLSTSANLRPGPGAQVPPGQKQLSILGNHCKPQLDQGLPC